MKQNRESVAETVISDFFYTSDFLLNDDLAVCRKFQLSLRKRADGDFLFGERKCESDSINKEETKMGLQDETSSDKDRSVERKRSGSVSMLFTSEMSDDGEMASSKQNEKSGSIMFLNDDNLFTGQKSYKDLWRNAGTNQQNVNTNNKKQRREKERFKAGANIFDSSFFFTSESNPSLCKGDSRKLPENNFQSLDETVKSLSKIKELSLSQQNNHILQVKPFQAHWTRLRKKGEKNYSVPAIKTHDKDLNRHFNADFWHNYDTGVYHSLPILGTGSSDSLMRISAKTISNIITKKNELKFLIIDCRFEYEFQGGHIKGAININTVGTMDSFYKKQESKVLIFHCEYSSIRAPRLAKYLRNKDRNENIYPNLKFPEIYILEGGYKEFYTQFSDLCTPMYYVSMDDKEETRDKRLKKN